MKHYSGDPRWVTVKWSAKCAHCGAVIPPGRAAFYYPNGKRFFAGACAETRAADFAAYAADEAQYNGM